jgi:predicted enzyme related to lactoylglutathione lyase
MAKIGHFEIPADDPQRASRFYHDVLGWEISRFGDEPYWLVRAGGDDEPGANGALVAREDHHRSPVVIAGVEDVDDVVSRVVSCGGKVAQVLAVLSRCIRCGGTLCKGDTRRVSQRISINVVLVAGSSYCCPARERGMRCGRSR